MGYTSSFHKKTAGAVGKLGTSANSADDVWSSLYGGNIAAACQATNNEVAVVDHPPSKSSGNEGDSVVATATAAEGEEAEAEAKQRKRRLTAWQSRERKRIEIEVLQERQQDLTENKSRLQNENKRIKLMIEHLKANKKTMSVNTTSPSDQKVQSYENSNSPSASIPSMSMHVATEFTKAKHESGSHMSLPFHHQAIANQQQHPLFEKQRLLAAAANAAAAAAAASVSVTRANSHKSSAVRRREGLALPPIRLPKLVPGQSHKSNNILSLHRRVGNDTAAVPTIFAPLQRGHDCMPKDKYQQPQCHQLPALYTQLQQQALQKKLLHLFPRGHVTSKNEESTSIFSIHTMNHEKHQAETVWSYIPPRTCMGKAGQIQFPNQTVMSPLFSDS